MVLTWTPQRSVSASRPSLPAPDVVNIVQDMSKPCVAVSSQRTGRAGRVSHASGDVSLVDAESKSVGEAQGDDTHLDGDDDRSATGGASDDDCQ